MKRIVQTGLLFLFILLLASSCQVRTTLNIDNDFKGSRIIEVILSSAEVKSLQPFDNVTDADSFENFAKMNAPAEMTVDSIVENSGGGYTITFIIDFESLDDYKAKVENILGRKPNIAFEKQENLFYPGYTIKEDFSSVELIKWAEDKLYEKKAIEKLSVSDVVYTQTSVRLGSAVKYTSDEKKEKIDVNFTNAYEIFKISITTDVLPGRTYKRTVCYDIPETTCSALGEDKILEYIKSFAPESSVCQWESGVVHEKGKSFRRMNISFNATVDELGSKTGAALNLESIDSRYTVDDAKNSAFRQYGTLKETFDFSKWSINRDGSCPVKIVYNLQGGQIIESAQNGKIENNKTVVTFENANAKTLTTDIDISADYDIRDISFKILEKNDGTYSKNMIFSFDEKTTNYSATHLLEYLRGMGADNTEYLIQKDGENYSQLVVSVSGFPETINKAFSSLLGSGNKFEINKPEGFSLAPSSKLSDIIDLSVILKDAGYSSPVGYSFAPSGSNKVSNIVLEDFGGTVLQKLSTGKDSDSFETSTQKTKFSVTYQIKTVSRMLIAVIIIGAIILAFIIILILNLIIKKHRRKNESGSSSNAIAVFDGETDDDGRETIIIEPQYDDGLSEPGDESEGTWLFINTIRVLCITALVMFFFSFANVTIGKLLVDKDASLSAFNLLFGGKVPLDLFGLSGSILYGGDTKTILLIIIPLLILLVLGLRKWISATVSSILTCALSVSQVFYLISVPFSINTLVQTMDNSISNRIDHTIGWAYYWSLVIYILIAASLLFVLILEFARIKRSKNSKNDPVNTTKLEALTDYDTLPTLEEILDKEIEEDNTVPEPVQESETNDIPLPVPNSVPDLEPQNYSDPKPEPEPVPDITQASAPIQVSPKKRRPLPVDDFEENSGF